MGRGIIDAPIDQVAAYIKNFKAIEDRDKNLVVSQEYLQARPFA